MLSVNREHDCQLMTTAVTFLLKMMNPACDDERADEVHSLIASVARVGRMFLPQDSYLRRYLSYLGYLEVGLGGNNLDPYLRGRPQGTYLDNLEVLTSEVITWR